MSKSRGLFHRGFYFFDGFHSDYNRNHRSISEGDKEMNEERTFIPEAINHLAKQEPGTPEYENAISALNVLVNIERTLKELDGPKGVHRLLNNGPLLGLVGNLAVSVLMLNFERTGIITSSVRSMIRSK
jgi:hypothetical protein